MVSFGLARLTTNSALLNGFDKRTMYENSSDVQEHANDVVPSYDKIKSIGTEAPEDNGDDKGAMQVNFIPRNAIWKIIIDPS